MKTITLIIFLIFVSVAYGHDTECKKPEPTTKDRIIAEYNKGMDKVIADYSKAMKKLIKESQTNP